jgi:DNA-binding MurR/RpiR family transcriptional regulator
MPSSSSSPASAQQRIAAAAQEASPSLARVGHWMAAHPIQTLSCSADEIASLTGTSVAAINRFSVAAGFEGFAHLKSLLGRELESVVDPVRKLDGARSGATGRAPKAGKSGKTKNGDAPIDGDALTQAGSVPQIQRAAGRLLKARNVWLLGLGTSSFVAGYGAHVLMPYLPQVWAIAGSGGTEVAARRLARCSDSDLLVAISLPRYSIATVRLAEFARKRGAHVIAITDSPTAPLATMADTLLLAPAQHAVLPSSALGALAVMEALVAAVMRLNPDGLRIARELSESVLSHLTTDAQFPGQSGNFRNKDEI